MPDGDDDARKAGTLTDDGVTVGLSERKLLQDLWAKQEEIAMHFNDLTIRLRLQALAGVGAAVVAAGALFTHEGRVNLRPIGGFLFALAAIWGAICVLDRYYYQVLLKGAVKSAIELEAQMGPAGRLSTLVEAEVHGTGAKARKCFYLVVAGALVAGAVACFVIGDAEIVRPATKDAPTVDAGADRIGSPAVVDAGPT